MSEVADGAQGDTAPPEGDTPPEGDVTPPEGDQTPEGDKGGDEGPPEKYELTLSEDGFLSQDDVDKTATEAKELGLTNEEAQILLDTKAEAVNEFMDAQNKIIEDAQKEWEATGQKDKEIGGEDYAKNIELGKRVIDKFGSDEFKALLNDSKYGDHPEVQRTFIRIGKLMGEDALVNAKGHKTSAPKTLEETFYGKS